MRKNLQFFFQTWIKDPMQNQMTQVLNCEYTKYVKEKIKQRTKKHENCSIIQS